MKNHLQIRSDLGQILVELGVILDSELQAYFRSCSEDGPGAIWNALHRDGYLSQPQRDALTMAEKGYIPVDAARVTVELHSATRTSSKGISNSSLVSSSEFGGPPPNARRKPEREQKSSLRIVRPDLGPPPAKGTASLPTFDQPMLNGGNGRAAANANSRHRAPTEVEDDSRAPGRSIDDATTPHSSSSSFHQPGQPQRQMNPSRPQAPATALPQLIGRQLGKYLISAKLGKGASGHVFLAQHVHLNMPVALKVLDPAIITMHPELVDRFIHEARTAARINHPNVVRLLDCDVIEGLYIIAMEYVEGIPVSDLIEMSGAVPENRALAISLATARGLEAALEAGIIHRDVKPANIMTTRNHQTKLADLGLGKLLTASAGEEKLVETSPHVALGTPHFFAPEQSRDASSVDHRADIYALGATLYTMLTGTYPFSGKSIAELIYKHQAEPIVPPRLRAPAVSQQTSDLVVRMMEKHPDNRPADYPELIQLLQNCIVAGQDAGINAPGGAANGRTTMSNVLHNLFRRRS